MKLEGHLISAVPLGITYYWYTADPLMTAVSMAATVLIDADHYLDYLILVRRFDPPFYARQVYENNRVIDRYFFWFHSWELTLLGWMVFLNTNHSLLGAVLAGVSLHLLIDQLSNTHLLGRYSVKPWFYFMIFRAANGFKVQRLRRDEIGLE